MYLKYARNNGDNDITSCTSFESKKNKLDINSSTKNEKEKLIGIKTLRSQLSSDDEDEESFVSNIKPSYTTLNLNETQSKKSKSTTRKGGRNIRIEDNWDPKLNHSSFTCKNNSESFPSLEFDNFVSSLKETTEIYSFFHNKFNEIKSLIKQKESIIEKYMNSKEKAQMHQKKISVLFEIITLKLSMINSIKSSKYYDSICQGCKNMASAYKNLFDIAVKEIKNIYSLENEINIKIEQISQKINEIEEGYKNENWNDKITKLGIKGDINHWKKKILNENKNIIEANNENINDINNIEEIEKQFSSYFNEINVKEEEK